jgi:hypothetical protein
MSRFFPHFEFTYVLLTTFLPMDTDFKIISLSYLPYSMNMMLNTNFLTFYFQKPTTDVGKK